MPKVQYLGSRFYYPVMLQAHSSYICVSIPVASTTAFLSYSCPVYFVWVHQIHPHHLWLFMLCFAHLFMISCTFLKNMSHVFSSPLPLSSASLLFTSLLLKNFSCVSCSELKQHIYCFCVCFLPSLTAACPRGLATRKTMLSFALRFLGVMTNYDLLSHFVTLGAESSPLLLVTVHLVATVLSCLSLPTVWVPACLPAHLHSSMWAEHRLCTSHDLG